MIEAFDLPRVATRELGSAVAWKDERLLKGYRDSQGVFRKVQGTMLWMN